MPTFVSMLNWDGDCPPSKTEICEAIDRKSVRLWARGMHSIIFLPDAEPAAVMVSTGDDYSVPAAIAGEILGANLVRIDSMRIDDDPPIPNWLAQPRHATQSRHHRAKMAA